MTPKPKTISPRRGAWVGLALLALALGPLASCWDAQVMSQDTTACARPRYNLALNTLERAKDKLAEFYKSRADDSLLDSYFMAQDAVTLAQVVKRCVDYDASYTRRIQNLASSASTLQTLARQNMRDADPWKATQLLDDRYREVFRNDIR